MYYFFGVGGNNSVGSKVMIMTWLTYKKYSFLSEFLDIFLISSKCKNLTNHLQYRNSLVNDFDQERSTNKFQ